jgi:hypothetical protein
LYLEISINEIIDLEVLVVITPRVEQRFRHLDPTKVSKALNQGEDWHVDHRGVEEEGVGVADGNADETKQLVFVVVVVVVVIRRLKELVAEQVGEDVRVDGDGGDLGVSWNERNKNTMIRLG